MCGTMTIGLHAFFCMPIANIHRPPHSESIGQQNQCAYGKGTIKERPLVCHKEMTDQLTICKDHKMNK